MSKSEVFSGPSFPVFGVNTGKYGQEKTPHLDALNAVHELYLTIIYIAISGGFRNLSSA